MSIPSSSCMPEARTICKATGCGLWSAAIPLGIASSCVSTPVASYLLVGTVISYVGGWGCMVGSIVLAPGVLPED